MDSSLIFFVDADRESWRGDCHKNSNVFKVKERDTH